MTTRSARTSPDAALTPAARTTGTARRAVRSATFRRRARSTPSATSDAAPNGPKRPAVAEAQSSGGNDPAWDERMRAHRRRQASVSVILDRTFGKLAESNPDLWDRRAYLMLVGVIYERLATGEADMPTEELIALAKVLAESRRAEGRTRAAHQTEAGTSANEPGAPPVGNGRLPDTFGEVVRQIYGAALSDREYDRPTKKQEAAETSSPAPRRTKNVSGAGE